MQSKRINRNFTYSAQLKSQAVQLYLKGQSCSSICEQLKIQDPMWHTTDLCLGERFP